MTYQDADGNADPYCGFGGQSGYYTDWETGTAASALTLLGLRYYDPSAGRFLTRDPASYRGGANLYEYCNNGPTNGIDPSGLLPWGGIIGGCFAAYAGLSGVTSADSCQGNYNNCKRLATCAAEISASVVAAAIVAMCDAATEGGCIPFDRFLIGCLQGLMSAGIGMALDALCQWENKCHDDSDPTCTALGTLIDMAAGCITGAIGGLVSQSTVKEMKEQMEAIIEGHLSAALDAISPAFEENCDARSTDQLIFAVRSYCG